MHRKNMGTYGEQAVITQCLHQGVDVFTDVGDNCRFDIIVHDANGKLHKVQVKCVGREESSLDSSCLYLYKSGPGYRFTYSASDTDWFALVDFQTGKIAWINAEWALKENKRVMRLSHVETNKSKMFVDFERFPFDK